MKIHISHLNFVFHIKVKIKSNYKFLNFVFQFIKNTKWHFGYTDSLGLLFKSVVFWLLLNIFIPTKQICLFTLCSYHQLKVMKKHSYLFYFFPYIYNLFAYFLFKRFCKRQYHLMVCCF